MNFSDNTASTEEIASYNSASVETCKHIRAHEFFKQRVLTEDIASNNSAFNRDLKIYCMYPCIYEFYDNTASTEDIASNNSAFNGDLQIYVLYIFVHNMNYGV
jgi:hypothetical protein